MINVPAGEEASCALASKQDAKDMVITRETKKGLADLTVTTEAQTFQILNDFLCLSTIVSDCAF